MLYLNKKDSKILFDINMVLYELFQSGKLSYAQERKLAEFYRLRVDSEIYSNQQRAKAKRNVQERRKIDKTYAHSKKKSDK